MNKKILIPIAIITLAVIGGLFSYTIKNKDTGTVTIGALLPLSGDIAVIGDQVKKGMEIAKKSFKRHNRLTLCMKIHKASIKTLLLRRPIN